MSRVSFLDQPDFSNVSSTPLDYPKEVGIGISKEVAQELAYRCLLTPSQQELLSWHNQLYHLLFNRLFQLARWRVLPCSILGCEDKHHHYALCVSLARHIGVLGMQKVVKRVEAFTVQLRLNLVMAPLLIRLSQLSQD